MRLRLEKLLIHNLKLFLRFLFIVEKNISSSSSSTSLQQQQQGGGARLPNPPAINIVVVLLHNLDLGMWFIYSSDG